MYRLLAAVPFVVLLPFAPADDAKPVELFNGKDLTGWKLKGDEKKSKWRVFVNSDPVLDAKNPAQFDLNSARAGVTSKGEKSPSTLVNTAGGGIDLYTEQKFGDCHLEIEFLVPKGSNSGVYLNGEYEVQVFDSWGTPDEKLSNSDVGSIYGTAPPKKNVSKAPGEWQKFVIDFQAPRFEGDKKVANAKFLRVELNGTVLHENVEVKGPTPACLTGKEAPTGPLMLQGDHGPVAYRNIRLTPKGK